ncbi:hypothetical protein BSKO_04955 [Bryopsis sp. KO-2023]|nr:hypothetical protein BSKO_04955 [Bryopsis sp. KO-2023]
MDGDIETTATPDSLVGPIERVALRKILSEPPKHRSSKELAPVYRLLQKIEFVAALDLKVQEELAKILNYEYYDPYTVVCKQGDIGTEFYIIISGALSVKKWTDDGNLVTICTLKAGQSFGELALVEKGGKRAATIITTSDVECLTVDGEQYRMHLGRIHREELEKKVDVLRHQPTFLGWGQKELEHLASIMMVKKVPYNTVIFEQGSEADALYFVKSGEDIVERLTTDPMLSSRFAPDVKIDDRFQNVPDPLVTFPRSVPCTPRGFFDTPPKSSRVKKKQDALRKQLLEDEVFVEIMTLGPYSAFGEVAALNGARRGASVISNSYTELLMLTRHDLLNKVNVSTRRKLENSSDAYRVDRDLMIDLVDGLKWERYKHDLVHSLLREQQKEFYLLSYTDRYRGHMKSENGWKP